MRTHDGKEALRGVRRHDGDQLALTGDIKRVQSQELASGGDLRLNGDHALQLSASSNRSLKNRILHSTTEPSRLG
jgi:hypothetical protein